MEPVTNILFVIGVSVILLILIPVAIFRWVLRINEIVKLLQEIKTAIKK